MLDTFKSILRDHCNLQNDTPILAGVSGGPDSLCLLSLLHEAGYRVIAAHFNHRLRPDADQDAAWVEAIAGRLGIPFVGEGGDVREYGAEKKISIETAARELRYRFLFEQAHAHRAQAVAVGHTADDQVETVLMHFIRGAGLNGLKGMPYRLFLQGYDGEIPLVRPLLDFWRAQTVAYCEAHQLQARNDASNDSLDFLRNRLRHELIPVLETYNPRFREAVWRSGKTLSADHDLLNAALEPSWKRTVKARTDYYLALDLTFLSEQPPALRMHMLARAVQCLLPGYDTSYADLQRAVAFLGDPGQDRTDFAGGLTLVREDQILYLAPDVSRLPPGAWPQMPAGTDSIIFSVPANLHLNAGWQFSAARAQAADFVRKRAWKDVDRFQALLDAQGLPEQLELRVRKPGDRFEPLGMEGHSQKLSDFFVNVKLPSRARERWPLLCADEHVIWVPGYRPSHAYRLRAGSTDTLCLSIRPPEH